MIGSDKKVRCGSLLGEGSQKKVEIFNGNVICHGGGAGEVSLAIRFFLKKIFKSHLESLPDCQTRFAHSLSFILCIYIC